MGLRTALFDPAKPALSARSTATRLKSRASLGRHEPKATDASKIPRARLPTDLPNSLLLLHTTIVYGHSGKITIQERRSESRGFSSSTPRLIAWMIIFQEWTIVLYQTATINWLGHLINILNTLQKQGLRSYCQTRDSLAFHKSNTV